MRTACLTAARAGVALASVALGGVTLAGLAPAQAGVHRHLGRHHAYARLHGRPYHIPRFDQGEAEAYVHTVYPYRTGLYVPWPDAYGAPYPY